MSLIESVLCIQWKSNRLGCAFYSKSLLELYIIEDVYESSLFGYLSQLWLHMLPNQVFISDSTDDCLCEWIQEQDPSVTLKTIPSKEFLFEKGRNELLNWYLSSMSVPRRHQHLDSNPNNDIPSHIYMMDSDGSHKTHAFLCLEGVLPMDRNHLTIGCAGVLLKELRRIENEEARDADHISIIPLSLKPLSCQMNVAVDSETMRSLCIFSSQSHPSIHQQEKESLSVFALLNKTRSTMGEKLMREWVSRPTRDRSVLDYRHHAINFFMESHMSSHVSDIRGYLRHIKNIHLLLSSIKQQKATVHDWQLMINFIYYSICISGVLNQLGESEMTSRIQPMIPISTLKSLGTRINSMIDFEASKQEKSIVIKNEVDSGLKQLRKKYECLENYLCEVAQQISSTLPIEVAAALNVVYFPQLGYLITLPNTIQIDQYPEVSRFDLQFTTAQNYYYKNNKVRELDSSIGDIHAMIIDKEIELIQSLSEEIISYSTQLLTTVRALSELDCLISLAVVASRFNYCQPTITDSDDLIIVEGRHPLQELCSEIFIPNDTYVEGGHGCRERRNNQQDPPTHHNSIQIVAGANYSGKSVYLKQIALIVYLAHIGSFVPASKVIIGLTDKIFTRLRTSESVSLAQSAFAMDVQRMNRAFQYSSRHSLVIIDEFGKGTDTADGTALFYAAIQYFLSKGNQCPKVIATTHFHESMTETAFSNLSSITLSQTDIAIERDQDGLMDEIVFLYKIVPKKNLTASYGLWCARMAGLPTHLINRARVLTQKYNRGEMIDRQDNVALYESLDLIIQRMLNTNQVEMDFHVLVKSIHDLMIE
ncbi:DNA mismatch repair protein MutS [Pilobolus umbonatus]|nr:DNA mismatch repair protein MutS [Pilobolus umbonatus]